MKRLVMLLAATTAFLTVGAMPALADNGPHVSTAFSAGVAGSTTTGVNTDRCAGCHRAHTGQSAYLLNATDETQLCYTCHGNSGVGSTVNVVDGIQYNNGTSSANKTVDIGTGQPSNNSVIAGVLRAGGFVNAAIGSGHMFQYYSSTTASTCTRTAGTAGACKYDELIPPLMSSYTGDASGGTLSTPVSFLASGTASSGVIAGSGTYVLQQTTSAHSVGGAAVTAWGSGASGTYSTDATVNLSCTSCHDPHGNGNYRILRPVPTGAQTGTAAVTIGDSSVKGYTTTNYWLVDDPNSPAITVNAGTGTYASSVFLSNISAWCSTCHSRLLDSSGSWSSALMDPNTTTVTLTAGTGTPAGTFATQGGVTFATAPLLADGTPVSFTSIGAGAGPSLKTIYYVKGCLTGTTCMLTTDIAGTSYVLVSTGSAAGAASLYSGTAVTFATGSTTITSPTGAAPANGTAVVLTNVAATAAATVNSSIYTGRVYYVVNSTGGSTFGLASAAGGSATKVGQAGAGIFVLASATTQDGSYMFRHTTDKAYVSSTAGGNSSATAGTRDPWANNPNCITCHVAHGSNASMAGDMGSTSLPAGASGSTTSSQVTFPDGTAGDSFLLRVDNRGTCRSCHNV